MNQTWFDQLVLLELVSLRSMSTMQNTLERTHTVWQEISSLICKCNPSICVCGLVVFIALGNCKKVLEILFTSRFHLESGCSNIP